MKNASLKPAAACAFASLNFPGKATITAAQVAQPNRDPKGRDIIHLKPLNRAAERRLAFLRCTNLQTALRFAFKLILEIERNEAVPGNYQFKL